MTNEQRLLITRQIGVLEGLTWLVNSPGANVGDALDMVINQLEKLLQEDDNGK